MQKRITNCDIEYNLLKLNNKLLDRSLYYVYHKCYDYYELSLACNGVSGERIIKTNLTKHELFNLIDILNNFIDTFEIEV